jgi:hypothetical protein
MTKKLNTNTYKLLVATGYILFGLLILTVALSTIIPYGTILINPYSIKLNVVVAMLSLTIGALLPVLVGYVIGDHSVKSKSALSHHFNGVLFGLLAYWVMTVFALFVPIHLLPFSDNNTRLIFMNLLPGIAVGIVAIALAIAHVRSAKASRDLLEYKPFVAVLISSILATPVVSLVNNVITNSVSGYSFVPLGVVVLIGLISYASIAKTRLTVITRVGWAAISVSVLSIAMYIFYILEPSVSGYFTPYASMESQAIGNSIATVLALIGWFAYWSLQVKSLRSIK